MFSKFWPQKRVYLDHAASTPLHPEVRRAMRPYFERVYGNPSAIHEEGRLSRRAIESAREQIASCLAIKPEGVVFTSGGTEANNLAIMGAVAESARAGRSYANMEVLTTAIEHPSVTNTLSALAERGISVQLVPVDGEGKIIVSSLQELVNEKTVLFTTAYANSEIGTVQPVGKIARTLRARATALGFSFPIHIDGAQAPLWLPCELTRLGVDMITLDAAKCGGPKGVGVLVRRTANALTPILYGGGQEGGLRPGTENVAGIVGAGAALALAQAQRTDRAARVARVRDGALQEIAKRFPQAILNGPTGDDRLANNINISLPGIDTEYAVVYLDRYGIAASTKSACAGAGGGESVVVRAISGDAARARSTLRLSLGEETTPADLSRTFGVLERHLKLVNI